ncbi:MAG: alpha-galactosidase [Pseudomonadota bacterium]
MKFGTPSVRRLTTDETELIVDVTPGGRPRIVYWGARLRHADPQELATLATRQWTHGGPSVDVPDSLSNELGAGLAGPPGLRLHRNGEHWATCLAVISSASTPTNGMAVVCEDANASVRVTYTLELDVDSHVLSAQTAVENLGDAVLSVDWCAALCVPLDDRLQSLTSFTGRWAGEFQRQDVDAFQGSVVRDNLRGRTSHEHVPLVIAREPDTNESQGGVAAFHLAWSGNHRVRIDRHNDGRAFAQLGELFFPGEMMLNAGDVYESPALLAAWSDDGLSTLSSRFHAHALKHAGGGGGLSKPRPVHFNTWEAMYFDHDEARILDLVDRAAAVGAERFVLDDGWFGSRRDDGRGLGDWWVSEEVYPDGLHRIAARVRERGMTLGLWFEPEMVNPDSELFRQHPDWVLSVDGIETLPARNQLALDLTRREVCDFLLARLSDVIATYGVDYIKWDMNRDVQHPGSAGRAVAHRQVRAVYALMATLRERFPELEIESCASGGARADFGVLPLVERLWISDNNDARDRQRIQRGASHLFPLAVSGAHVGPRQCHITQRAHSMAFRAATAMFGHMGLELDLADETEADLEKLRAAIALHKRHRALIHTGRHYRIDTRADLTAFAVVAPNQKEALVSCATLDGHASTLPPRLRVPGLDDAQHYRLKLVWPRDGASITTPSIVDAASLSGDGALFSGESIRQHGLQLPLTYPDVCLVFHFEAIAG